MTSECDNLINLESGYVDWEAIIRLSKEHTGNSGPEDTERKLSCKKCGEKFFNKNYAGNFALCDKHRNNTFKK